MIPKKINLLLFGFLIVFINLSFIQDEKAGTNLSFLKGQKYVRLEFSYEGLTINGELEDAYVQKQITKLNEKNPGNGDELLNDWKKQKDNRAPQGFAAFFHNNLAKTGLDCVMDFELETYPPVDKSKSKTKEKPKPVAKYVCVVSLTSIKTGIGKLITPTLWITYTFYENEKRDKVLASFKSHHDYGRDEVLSDSQGNTRAVYEGSWTQIDHAYYEGGKFIAKQIKKDIK